MSIRPTLASLVIGELGGSIIDSHIYDDGNGTKWVVAAVSYQNSAYDSLVVTTLNGTTFTELRGPNSGYGLTKGCRYTFANHMGRCYVSNYRDPLWWFDTAFIASTFSPVLHEVKNAPMAQYLIASKNRLFAAKVQDYTFPATHMITKGDSNTLDGIFEFTSDGSPNFIQSNGLKNVFAGDKLAFCNYTTDAASLANLGTSLTITPTQTTIDAMDATTGWTAVKVTGTSNTLATNTVEYVEGTASNKYTTVAVTDRAYIWKNVTSFDGTNQRIVVSFYVVSLPATLTSAFIRLSSTAGGATNYNEYTFPVAGLVAGWNHLKIDVDVDTPASTNGTFVKTAIVDLWLGTNFNGSTGAVFSWDYVRRHSKLFAVNDYVSFASENYLRAYQISAISYSNLTLTLTLATAFLGTTLSGNTQGVITYGGNFTTTTSYKTSGWLNIEQVLSSGSVALRTATDFSGTNQHFVIRRIKENSLMWSALDASNDWTEPGVEGDEIDGVQELNQAITGLASFGNTTLIATEDSWRALLGTAADDWYLAHKTKSDIGCSSHWSIVSKDNWLAFYNKTSGFQFMKGGQIANQSEFFNISTLASESASDLIKNYVLNIDKDLATQVRGTIYKDLLMFSVPNSLNHTNFYANPANSTCTFTNGDATVTGVDTVFLGNVQPGDYIAALNGGTYYEVLSITDSTHLELTTFAEATVTTTTGYVIKKRRNNDLLILDTKVSAASNSYIGWTIGEKFFANSFINTGTNIYYGGSCNGRLYRFDYGGTLLGADMSALFQTAVWDGGLPEYNKVFDRFDITCKGNETVLITPIVDGIYKSPVSYTFTSINNTETVTFPRFVNGVFQQFASRGKTIQFEVSVTGQGQTTVLGINFYGTVLSY